MERHIDTICRRFIGLLLGSVTHVRSCAVTGATASPQEPQVLPTQYTACILSHFPWM